MKTMVIVSAIAVNRRSSSPDSMEALAWALIATLLILAVVIGIIYYFEERK